MRVDAVVHPLTVDDPQALRTLLERRCAELGHEFGAWRETTPADGGTGQARAAVEAGADVVVVAGGDGTVMAVATALAHTGTALALLPTGTGNLLARNLELPLELPAAVEVALGGRPRQLDVGCATLDGDRATVRRFTVMAGIGFDAAMMADASPALKARLGWPAYVLSAVRHLRDDAMKCTIITDDGPPRQRRVRAVLVANVGRLQGGVELLPDARPDDGLLDVAVVAPRGPVDWLRVAGRVLRSSRVSDRRLERLRVRRVEVRTTRPRQCEYDGDPVGRATLLQVNVEPGALTVLLPR